MRKLPVIAALSALLWGACGEKESGKLFTKISHQRSGVNFRNLLQESPDMNVLLYQYFYNGAGVAIGDLNNDGLPDLFFSGNMVKNRLFVNEGDLKFKDVTKTAGVAEAEGWCTGATMVDINSDGWLDIYVCRSADLRPEMRRNLLFINNKDLTFTESAAQYGLADPAYSTHAAFFDMDKDGDLDAFVINHSLNEYAGDRSEKPGIRSQQNPDFQSKLFRNDNGKFLDISQQAGIVGNVLSFGLGLGVSDVNGDGWEDVYVCNDFNEQDYLFINNRNGTFTERLADFFDHTSLFSMGCDFGDINNDGLPDLASLDMLPDDHRLLKMHAGPDNWKKFDDLFRSGFYNQYMRNMLQLNNGDGTFSEIGQLAGVSNTDWSWGVLLADLDNDGWKDMTVTNGYVKDYTDMDFLKFAMDKAVQSKVLDKNVTNEELLKNMPGSKISKFAFQNRGNLQFDNVTEAWGLNEMAFSYGIAHADLDNDGDLDLVVNNINDYASIYRNDADKLLKNNWLQVKLEGDGNNRQGFGTRVWLYGSAGIQFREQQPSRGYESCVDEKLHFGLGITASPDSLVVVWPDLRKQVVANPKPNQVLVLQQKNASPGNGESAVTAVSRVETLPFKHAEKRVNDFNTQFLLPHFLSYQGPRIAKADVNKDGLDDVFFGAAAGQPGALLLQKNDGSFIPEIVAAFQTDADSEDTDAAFFDADGDGDEDLYVVSGGYEAPAGDPSYQDRLYLNMGGGRFEKAVGALPNETAAGSCATPGDFDFDGDLDVFVGGRTVPANYPAAAESFLLINDGKGHFANQLAELAPGLAQSGMVTDAVWLQPSKQLVLAGEWMPLTTWNFQTKQKTEAPNSSGWWNCLTVADLDGDGDSDLLAGNLGRNAQMKASTEQPVELFYGDFDGNGATDPILCHFRSGKSYPALSRDDLADQMPSIKKKFPDYKSYSTAAIGDVLDQPQLAAAKKLTAVQLETVWLDNTGKEYIIKQLPIEAQFAPVYAAAADDFDGDGHTDLFLAGNNRWARIYFGRYNANHGQLFLGDGKGNFRYVSSRKTGIQIRSDVRDAAVVKGKTGKSIVVGVNNGQAVRIPVKPAAGW